MLTKKRIMLTGAGGALAYHVGKALRNAGAELILVDREDYAFAAEERLGTGEIVQADLTQPESIEILREYSQDVYALVHTVGGFAMQNVIDSRIQDLEQQMRVNFYSLYHASQAILPELIRQQRGAIIGISAGQVVRGEGAGAALYTASKAAVASFLRVLDAELPADVSASVLYPMGAFDTPSNRLAMPDQDPNSWIDPAQLAESVVYLLSRTSRGRVPELMVYPPKP